MRRRIATLWFALRLASDRSIVAGFSIHTSGGGGTRTPPLLQRPQQQARVLPTITTTTTTTTRLYSSSSNQKNEPSDNDGGAVVTTATKDQESSSASKNAAAASSMMEQARRIREEAERMERVLMLEKTNSLEKELQKIIKNGNNHNHDGDDEERKQNVRLQIEQLAKRIDPTFVPRPMVTSSTSSGSSGSSGSSTTSSTTTATPIAVRDALTPTELFEACSYFRELPPQMRVALAFAVGEVMTADNERLSKEQVEGVVSKLYLQQDELLRTDNTRLIEALQMQFRGFTFTNDQLANSIVRNNSKNNNSTTTAAITVDFNDEESVNEFYDMLTDFDVDKLDLMENSIAKGSFVENYFPRQTRRDNEAPSTEDAQSFVNEVLLTTKTTTNTTTTTNKKSTLVFNPTAPPEAVPGGFVIRGAPVDDRLTSGEVVAALDEAFSRVLPETYADFNFYYVQDPTAEAANDPDGPLMGQPVLFLTGRNLSPTTDGLVFSAINALSFVLLFLFCIGAFADNELVMSQLTATDPATDAANVDWFNTQLLLPQLLSLIGIQLAHESAHLAAARWYDFKMAAPTFLPSLPLPYYGAATPVKTSPPNLTALFDFAVLGPTAGLAASLATLYAGLSLTLAADPTTVFPLFPLCPLELLRSSALGGTLVDSYLYGGMMNDGSVGNGNMQLHPLAIGGFCGLVVNALNLLPLGNTDGGRISQSLFGRSGHSLIQALVYVVILGTGFFGGDKQNILLGYALLTTLGQGEKEIPCRDELENVPIPRVFFAIALWFTAALILMPLE